MKASALFTYPVKIEASAERSTPVAINISNTSSTPVLNEFVSPQLPEIMSSHSLPLVPSNPGDPKASAPAPRVRRFSFHLFFFSRPHHTHEDHKPALSTVQDHEKKVHAAAALSKRLVKISTSKADKRARKSALVVQRLIVGPSSAASPKLTAAVAKPQLNKIKSQLIKPKSANKVIAQLRSLPVMEASSDGVYKETHAPQGPIHAVCLEHTDPEEEELHFAQLTRDTAGQDFAFQSFGIPGVASASLDKLNSLFNDMRIVDLLTAPDLGLGQPGDGEGLLAGAIPTAETVLRGMKEITPQLMALGFATGRAVHPDHAGSLHIDIFCNLLILYSSGVYPPTDRMSVLTCE